MRTRNRNNEDGKHVTVTRRRTCELVRFRQQSATIRRVLMAACLLRIRVTNERQRSMLAAGVAGPSQWPRDERFFDETRFSPREIGSIAMSELQRRRQRRVLSSRSTPDSTGPSVVGDRR